MAIDKLSSTAGIIAALRAEMNQRSDRADQKSSRRAETPAAHGSARDIKVLRKQGGRDLVFPFNYSEIRKGNHLEQNITLKGGDVVVVP